MVVFMLYTFINSICGALVYFVDRTKRQIRHTRERSREDPVVSHEDSTEFASRSKSGEDDWRSTWILTFVREILVPLSPDEPPTGFQQLILQALNEIPNCWQSPSCSLERFRKILQKLNESAKTAK